MTNPLLDRTESAVALMHMDSDEIAAAMLADTLDPAIAGATARFEPPTEPLSRAELEAAAAATTQVIAAVEAKLRLVAGELDRLPRSIPQSAETGERIDIQS